jgi:hypothetical protein
LVGVAQQGEYAVGDQIDRGFVSGDEQQHCGGRQFLAGESSGRVGVVDERGQHVSG